MYLNDYYTPHFISGARPTVLPQAGSGVPQAAALLGAAQARSSARCRDAAEARAQLLLHHP
jgi:hypothetical protein